MSLRAKFLQEAANELWSSSREGQQPQRDAEGLNVKVSWGLYDKNRVESIETCSASERTAVLDDLLAVDRLFVGLRSQLDPGPCSCSG